MKCPRCGQEGQAVGLGQTYECPKCGARYVGSTRQPAMASGAAAATGAKQAEATRLAQIRQRAAEERAAKGAEAAAPEAPRAGQIPARVLHIRWAAAFVAMLAVMAAGMYLSRLDGAQAPRSTAATTEGGLRALAEAGETGAQFALGLLNDYGYQGSTGDPEEAFKWYLKAAAAGDIDAQYHLGQWYRTRSPKPEPAEGVYWTKAAAEQGQPTAQAVLGDLYWGGGGVAKDLEQAAAWYTRAADQGNALAHCGLARLYAGTEAGYRQDPAAAAMHDYVARYLGKECGLKDYGAGANLADWAKKEGVRRGQERVAKGFVRRPLR